MIVISRGDAGELALLKTESPTQLRGACLRREELRTPALDLLDSTREGARQPAVCGFVHSSTAEQAVE
jgi:hypothetical protein